MMPGKRRSHSVLALLALLLTMPISASHEETPPRQEGAAAEQLRCERWRLRRTEDRTPDDADVLALRVLHRASDDFLPDESRVAELSSELAAVLLRLKSTYPEFTRFPVRNQSRGLLSVSLDDEFALAVRDALEDQCDMLHCNQTALLHTGHKAFDELNEKMGLRHVDLYETRNTAFLHLHEQANLRAAALAYSALDVIESAKPNEHYLDFPDLDARPHEEGWLIETTNANKEVSYFLAIGETVQRMKWRCRLVALE